MIEIEKELIARGLPYFKGFSTIPDSYFKNKSIVGDSLSLLPKEWKLPYWKVYSVTDMRSRFFCIKDARIQLRDIRKKMIKNGLIDGENNLMELKNEQK